jgi:pilus assembly protein CpaF
VESDIIETEPVFEQVDGELRRGPGLPPRLERFERIGVDVAALLGGS